MTEKGNLSINSDNLLPIIKKWLYSETDIFVRELVSNAVDAIMKLKKLSDMGDAPGVSKDEEYAIYVKLDKEGKRITVEDNGIGMTADEIKQYINQIAFSGASDFIEKYKDKVGGDDIIGHFGLGFYSVFMVANQVEIDTLSYREGAEAAKWISDGGVEYEITESQRAQRGTTITLHVMEEEEAFLDSYRLLSILRKYCGFLPINIFFDDGSPKKTLKDGEVTDEPTPINDTAPLWAKQPNECTDEEYVNFYQNVFADFNEPLFWIHLNMDYPFRLKGILYFPKLKHELEYIEGQVKLYNNQVFVADNIKEVIPDFLLLLKGTLDCLDLPLNVSRSFLQNDAYVSKMAGYITRKVADKINSICKKDREQWSGYWDDINPFIKYGCIRDNEFYEKVKPSVLYKTTAGDYVTLTEFLERNKEKTQDSVFYINNEQQQAQYIKLFRDQGMEAVFLSTKLDNPFISYIESYEKDVHFCRIDSDITDALKDESAAEDADLEEALRGVFRKVMENDELEVKTESLKNSAISALMLQSEQSRRISEMSRMMGGAANMPHLLADDVKLVLNRNNPLVELLVDIKDDETKTEDVALMCHQIYDLAMMSHRPLGTDAMTRFIERSNLILEKAARG